MYMPFKKTTHKIHVTDNHSHAPNVKEMENDPMDLKQRRILQQEMTCKQQELVSNHQQHFVEYEQEMIELQNKLRNDMREFHDKLRKMATESKTK